MPALPRYMIGRRRNMNIRPYYAFQKRVFPDEVCDRIVAEGEKLPHSAKAKVGSPGHGRRNEALRETELAFFPQRPEFAWLYEPVLQCIQAANAKFWNFRLTGLERVQYGIYNPGQFYGWHIDQHPNPYEEGPYKGLTRKLSLSLQLTDDEAYDGGDFELREPGEEDVVQRPDGIRPRGSVIIFPSFVFHRVTPVTRGVRRSLVAWFIGPPFV